SAMIITTIGKHIKGKGSFRCVQEEIFSSYLYLTNYIVELCEFRGLFKYEAVVACAQQDRIHLKASFIKQASQQQVDVTCRTLLVLENLFGRIRKNVPDIIPLYFLLNVFRNHSDLLLGISHVSD